jgi:hypothetical protein
MFWLQRHINIWGDSYASYPDLVILQCTHVLKTSCCNPINIYNYFSIEKKGENTPTHTKEATTNIKRKIRWNIKKLPLSIEKWESLKWATFKENVKLKGLFLTATGQEIRLPVGMLTKGGATVRTVH